MHSATHFNALYFRHKRVEVNLVICEKYAVSFSRFHCCRRHGILVAVMVMVCGCHGMGPTVVTVMLRVGSFTSREATLCR